MESRLLLAATEPLVLDHLVVRFNSAANVIIERTLDNNTATETQTLTGRTPLLLDDFARVITFELSDASDRGVVLSDVNGADGFMRLSGPTLRTITFHVGNDPSLFLDGNGGSDSITVSSLDAALTGMSVTLLGGMGNDLLDATALTSPVRMSGDDGNDTLKGGGGDDDLYGAAGNDVLTGGAGTDFLHGDDGNDNLDAGDGDYEIVTGGLGNDTLKGGNGFDKILERIWGLGLVNPINAKEKLTRSAMTGTLGADSISGFEMVIVDGTDGNDTLDASAVPATIMAELFGRGGDDSLIGGFGDDLIGGGDGNDSLRGGGGSDSLWGEDGTDCVVEIGNFDLMLSDTTLSASGTAAGGLDSIDSIETACFTGGGDNNTLDASGFTRGPVTLNGAGGDDTLIGSAQADSLSGGAGHDLLDGREGNDCLHGDSGNDKLLGGNGNDTLRGGVGNDSLNGGTNDDVLLGESGNDTLLGDTGDDILIGRDGNDSISGDDGNDTLFGGTGADKLSGGTGDDVLSGDDGKDTLNGDDGNDTLFGGPDPTDSLSTGETNSPDGVFNNIVNAAFFTHLDDLLAAC